MARAYKNFWSLNTDEAVTAGILRDAIGKNDEVFIPLNAQMKDVDLVLIGMNNRKSLSLQIKGSRAYEPRKSETRDFGEGSCGWFFFPRKRIDNSTADYFVFLIYILENSKRDGRRYIVPHTVILPTKKLKSLAKQYKTTHGADRYSFLIWINPRTRKAFDIRDKQFDVSGFLDGKGLEKLRQALI
jgi:hypothetical protein